MNNISFIDFVNSNIEKYMKEQNHKMLIAFRNIKSEYVYMKEKSGETDTEIIKRCLINERKLVRFTRIRTWNSLKLKIERWLFFIPSFL